MLLHNSKSDSRHSQSEVSVSQPAQVQEQKKTEINDSNDAEYRHGNFLQYVKCLRWIEDKLGLMLARIGETCAMHPGRTICICVLVSLVCAFGFVRLNVIHKTEELWVDPKMPPKVNKRWIHKTYGPQAQYIRLIVANDGEDKASKATVQCPNTDGTAPNTMPCICGVKKTKCGENSHCISRNSLCVKNTLTVEAFREMMILDKRIRELTVKFEDSKKPKKRFVDYCFKSPLPGEPCLISSPLEIWSAPSIKYEAENENEKTDSDGAPCSDISDAQVFILFEYINVF